MKEELVFEEHHNAKQWGFVAVAVIANVFLIFLCIKQIALGTPVGNNPINNIVLIAITALSILLTVILFFAQLNTVINNDGIYVRIFPLRLRFKFIPWEMVSEAVATKVNILGGFGIMRINLGNIGISSGIGYTYYKTGGNKALKLVLKNNKKIYIGTRRVEELSEFLNKLNAEREQDKEFRASH
jgi:hypothetical protein